MDFSTLYTTIIQAQLTSRLKKWFSVASQRGTENKCISILLLVVTSLILSKVIQNLITNINRTRSFI